MDDTPQETITLEQWVAQFPGITRKSQDLWCAIRWEFEQQKPPMTVRQMFYRMSVAGAVPKTEQGYRKVVYALLKMRRAGAIPYGWIADSTRWMRKPQTYSGMGDALRKMHRYYRRELWADQPVYVEIWLEKDALSGVVHEVTSEFDVPLYVARGYASETFLYDAAQGIMAVGKPAYVYHFGDYDPSGQDAARDIADKLRGFGAAFTFVQAAVTQQQVTDWNLPTRPTKRQDTRAKNWRGESVELDAIPPAQLRQLVRDVIESHLDPDLLRMTRRMEAQERDVIADLAVSY
jgi:hypothetical protein